MKSWPPLRAAALLVWLGLGAACSGSEPDSELDSEQLRSPIFAGRAVPDGEWESVVALGHRCTGVLIDASIVVYAAHCGTRFEDVVVGSRVDAPRLRVPVRECRAHPQAALGNGRDVAYCSLSEPLWGVAPLCVVEASRLEALAVATPVTLVGFGPDSQRGEFGVKRLGRASIAQLGDDLLIASTETGTCSGDSGGPALLNLNDIDANLGDEWRVLGVLSAGTSFECQVSTDHYTNLRAVTDWLEAESGVELSACIDRAVGGPPEAAAEGSLSSGEGCHFSAFRAGSGWVLLVVLACSLGWRSQARRGHRGLPRDRRRRRRRNGLDGAGVGSACRNLVVK
jgi:hypothetical protein